MNVSHVEAITPANVTEESSFPVASNTSVVDGARESDVVAVTGAIEAMTISSVAAECAFSVDMIFGVGLAVPVDSQNKI